MSAGAWPPNCRRVVWCGGAMSEARLQASGSGLGTATAEGASWIDAELAGCALGDKRLCDRLRWLLHQLEGAMGAPLPLACQDWANTKAAYRFFSNERFGEDAILAGHFQATASRFAATAGLVLEGGPNPGHF